MADITMCNDLECSARWHCHRAQAQASARQSYFVESPRDGDECTYFWDNRLTVEQFKKRAAASQVEHSYLRSGQAMYNMAFWLFGDRFQTEEFEHSGDLDPFYDDRKCDAFIAFLTKKELLLP